MKKIFIFTFLLLLVACAPAPVPATATLTLMLTPTRVPTLTPTATITPTPTPSLPLEVSAVLEGQDYKIFENDKIVAANGETLFRWVPEADRVDPSAEWQRMITFTTTEGEKIEMPRFETFDDALKYISKHAYWRTGDYMKADDFWSSLDNPKRKEYVSLLEKIKKIPGRSSFIGTPYFNDTGEFCLIRLNKVNDNSIIRFEPEENGFEFVYVNDPAENFNAN